MSELHYFVRGKSYGVRQYAELQHVSVTGVISDAVAQINLIQTYVNPLKEEIEAVYTFPLYEGMTVVSFEVKEDGRKLVCGSMREKFAGYSTKEYEEAVKAGKVEKLLDPERPDLLQVSIGRIRPLKTISIQISLIAELKPSADANQVCFVLPTDVAPLFSDQKGASAVISAPSSTPKLSINMMCAMSKAITSIQSPSHRTIEVHRGSSSALKTTSTGVVCLERNHARVSLTMDSLLDRDLVIIIDLLGLDQPRVLIEQHPSDGSHAISITFSLRFLLQSLQTTEIVFLVDRSGSMEGTKIESVRVALELFLKSIPTGGHYFNIIGFGSSYERLFKRSVIYDEMNLEKATQYARGLQANFGGTKITEPIQDAFVSRHSHLPMLVFVLTDGRIDDVGNLIHFTREAVAKGATENAYSRVYTLGIGKDVDPNLIASLAEVGGGEHEFVLENERMEKKVVNMLKVALMPLVTNVWVQWTEWFESDQTSPVVNSSVNNWNCKMEPTNLVTSSPQAVLNINLPIEQAPFNIPNLDPNDRFTVYGILLPTTPLPKELVLKGSSRNGLVEYKFSVGDCIHSQGDSLHSLAAHALVRDLEAGSSCIDAALGRFRTSTSDQVLQGLGVQGNLSTIVSALSSEKVAEILKQKTIDLALKYNLASKYTSWVAIDKNSEQTIDYDRCDVPTPQRPRPSPIVSPPPAPSNNPRADLETLLKNQSHEGLFPLVPDIAALFSTNVDELRNKLALLREEAGLTISEPELESCWTTRASVDFMKKKLGDLKQEWDLVAEKAENSVGTLLKSNPEAAATIKEAAEKAVRGESIVNPRPSKEEIEAFDLHLRPFMAHQDSDGLLPLIPEIAAPFKTTVQYLKDKLNRLRKKLPGVGLLDLEWEKLWATTLGVEFMRMNLPDLKQEWGPFVENAEKKVESMLLKNASDVAKVKYEAKSIFQRQWVLDVLKQVVWHIGRYLKASVASLDADTFKGAMERAKKGLGDLVAKGNQPVTINALATTVVFVFAMNWIVQLFGVAMS